MYDFSPFNLARHFVENRGKLPDPREKSEEPQIDPSRARDLILDELLAIVDGDEEMMSDEEDNGSGSGSGSEGYQSAIE